jgi:hypothetical protein
VPQLKRLFSSANTMERSQPQPPVSRDAMRAPAARGDGSGGGGQQQGPGAALAEDGSGYGGYGGFGGYRGGLAGPQDQGLPQQQPAGQSGGGRGGAVPPMVARGVVKSMQETQQRLRGQQVGG